MTAKDKLARWVPRLSEAQAARFVEQIEEDFDDLKAAEDALREAEEKGTIPWEEALKELGMNAEPTPSTSPPPPSGT